MRTYCLLVDVWEGQLEVDETTLLANGVAGMLIRLNDMNGGHHMDTNFAAQWEQAKSFARAPYFVYNPWVDGPQNFAWLGEHIPDEAKSVMIDIEVRKDGYPPTTYAAEVKKFIALAKTRWRTVIYTGEWFLSYLSSWPTDVDYWWAQYPYAFYPSDTRYLTWDQLRAELEPFTGPSNAAKCPGPLRMWQFTGDKLVLPGNPKPIDVNTFFGTRAELDAWLGMPAQNTDVVTYPFKGVKRVTGRRFNSDVYVTIMDLSQVRVEVMHEQTGDGLFRPSQMAKTRGAHFAWNGDEYIKQNLLLPHKPAELAYSKGFPYVSRTTAVPSLNVRQSGVGEIGHMNFPAAYNVTSGYRYLIENGIIKSYLSGSEIQYVERHPRSCFALTQDGQLINLTVDGRTARSAGATLKECARILQEFEAWTAYDRGSGGDTVDVMNGEIQNVPCDTFPDGSAGAERAVSQAVLVYADGGSMENGTAKEVLGKTGTIRTSPEVASGNDTGKRVAAFSTIEFVEVVNGTSVPADKWFKLPDGNYLNYILGGRAYYQILTQPTIPPPTSTVADMPYTITFGGSDSPYVATTISGVIEAKK